MNLNKVTLIGRISQQPVASQSRSGVSFVRFNIAVSRDFQRNSEDITDFIPLVAFDNTANFINRYFNKGDLVVVIGTLQSSQYTSKSGDLVHSLTVSIDQIKSLEPASIKQARVEKNGAEHYNEGQPTFYVEEANKSTQASADVNEDSKEDNPWELDL